MNGSTGTALQNPHGFIDELTKIGGFSKIIDYDLKKE
jgi:hypothetical protein